MAISSYGIFLMYKANSSANWTKLIDIKDFPDLGGDPDLLDITTLSDGATRNILGIQSQDAFSFTANSDVADFTRLKKLEGKDYDFAVWMGKTIDSTGAATPSGTDGKFSFTGQLSVHPVGAGVNEVVDMAITIAASTIVKFSN